MSSSPTHTVNAKKKQINIETLMYIFTLYFILGTANFALPLLSFVVILEILTNKMKNKNGHRE